MVDSKKVREVLMGIGGNGPVSDEYWPRIVDSILDDVVGNVKETADPDSWNEDDVRLAVGRVLCDRLGIGEEEEDELDVVELPFDDVPALFADYRIDRKTVPEGLYVYDLRGDDETGDPASVEEHVTVNHAGCIVTASKLDIPESGFIDLGEGLNFTGDMMTMRKFLEESRKEGGNG